MLLNEKGLRRAMVAAWRDGYVAYSTGVHLILFSDAWYVRAPLEKFPAKALGALVEYGRGLPGADPLYLKKGFTAQYHDQSVTLGQMDQWEHPEVEGRRAEATTLLHGAFQLFQARGNGARVYGVDAQALEMIAGGADNTATGEILEDQGTIRWGDAEDDAVVYMAVKRSSEDWWQILETAVLPRA